MISKMLTLSTIHIKPQTYKDLDESVMQPKYKEPVIDLVIYNKCNFGFFICIADWENDIDQETVPKDLKDCIEYARECDCDWLCFDSDGEIESDLLVYDWRKEYE